MKLFVVVFLISCGLVLKNASTFEHSDIADLGKLIYILAAAKDILTVEHIDMPAIPGQAQNKTIKYVSVN